MHKRSLCFSLLSDPPFSTVISPICSSPPCGRIIQLFGMCENSILMTPNCFISRDQGGRTLCGVMRIGLVAKGLLIKDDMDLELVLMCKEKPTKTLLCLVKDNLPAQIQVS